MCLYASIKGLFEIITRNRIERVFIGDTTLVKFVWPLSYHGCGIVLATLHVAIFCKAALYQVMFNNSNAELSKHQVFVVLMLTTVAKVVE